MPREDQPRALVNLEALTRNYQRLDALAAPGCAGAAVKANGYGLGVVPVAQALRRAGCASFFVAHVQEALELRDALGAAPVTVAVLHGLDPAEAALARARNITPVLNDRGAVEGWGDVARRTGESVRVFIHLDTGLNRLGLPAAEQRWLLETSDALAGLEVVAWLSHLACADEPEHPLNALQRDRFRAVRRMLPAAPASFRNSSGLFLDPSFGCDLARPGIALYGGNPTPGRDNPMEEVVRLQAPVLQVRDVDRGESVGYGAAYRARRRTRVATLALGYADGFPRVLGEQGFAWFDSPSSACSPPSRAVPDGPAAPWAAHLIGRISMDLVTLDVTDLPPAVAAPGCWATLMGGLRPLDAVARAAGTLSYEILTGLGPRVARIYGPEGAA